MLSLPVGSPRTRSLWGGQQRHAIRIETVILASCSLSVILAAADMATTNMWRYDNSSSQSRQITFQHSLTFSLFPSLGIWFFPIPVLSLGLSASAIFVFTKRTLHPTYSVSVATTLFCVWVLTLAFASWSDQWREWRPSSPTGLVMVKDILYGTTTLS